MIPVENGLAFGISVCVALAGGCHGRWELACVVAMDALEKCCPTGEDQLSRGRRNLGTVWIVFAMADRDIV